MKQRIIGIDIARAIAILLVTWKHCMASFGARGQLDGWSHYGLELVMQFATPTFLILFGAMLEMVYRPRYEVGRTSEIKRRLYKRSLQCYGYYCLAIIVFFTVLGTYSWMSLPLVFTGFISVPFSHLLAFYTAALALAPAMIYLRVRFGLAPFVIFAFLVHLAHPLLTQLPPAPELFGRDYLLHMSGFLYGRGVDFMGPSLLHGLAIVCLGMLFGYGLNPVRDEIGSRSISPKISIWIAGATTVIVVLLIDWKAPLNSLQSLTDASLRVSSHPLYFGVGILGALGIAWVCIYLYDFQDLKLGRSIQVFGRRSLFAFGVGNILAHIAPKALVNVFGIWGSVAILFGLICALTIIYDRFEARRPPNGYIDRLTLFFVRNPIVKSGH